MRKTTIFWNAFRIDTISENSGHQPKETYNGSTLTFIFLKIRFLSHCISHIKNLHRRLLE